jgi:hypothetical protein
VKRSTIRLAVILLASASTPGAARAQLLQASPEPPSGKLQQVSLDQYREHLQKLLTLTEGCAKARDLETCDPALVGPDDEIPWGGNGQKRIVRFGWLRILFSRAQLPDEAMNAKQPARMQRAPESNADVRSTSQLLDDALDRLKVDLEKANAIPGSEAAHASERAVLKQVLAGREFRNLKQPDRRDSVLEKFSNWLNKLFERLGKLQVRAAWVGRTLILGFLLLVGVALAWVLLQMERRWRMRLVPESDRPAPGAASARDWQLWVNDAREAAARGQWREAIHFLYWAAISRLESKKLWPADRARTPRESLDLLAPDDPRNAGLGALTREFEVTWYGGRYAGEAEYRRAEDLAQTLFQSGAAQALRSQGVQ